MKFFSQFAQKVMHDLGFTHLSPAIKKAFELRIGEVVDHQIQEALEATLTEKDWSIYDEVAKKHPNLSEQEAVSKMLEEKENLPRIVEAAFVASYDDLMAEGEAFKSQVE